METHLGAVTLQRRAREASSTSGKPLRPPIIIKYTNARARAREYATTRELCKNRAGICLAIHNQLRSIHYRAVTPSGLKLLAISLPCNASFLLRARRARAHTHRTGPEYPLRFQSAPSGVSSTLRPPPLRLRLPSRPSGDFCPWR